MRWSSDRRCAWRGGSACSDRESGGAEASGDARAANEGGEAVDVDLGHVGPGPALEGEAGELLAEEVALDGGEGEQLVERGDEAALVAGLGDEGVALMREDGRGRASAGDDGRAADSEGERHGGCAAVVRGHGRRGHGERIDGAGDGGDGAGVDAAGEDAVVVFDAGGAEHEGSVAAARDAEEEAEGAGFEAGLDDIAEPAEVVAVPGPRHADDEAAGPHATQGAGDAREVALVGPGELAGGGADERDRQAPGGSAQGLDGGIVGGERLVEAGERAEGEARPRATAGDIASGDGDADRQTVAALDQRGGRRETRVEDVQHLETVTGDGTGGASQHCGSLEDGRRGIEMAEIGGGGEGVEEAGGVEAEGVAAGAEHEDARRRGRRRGADVCHSGSIAEDQGPGDQAIPSGIRTGTRRNEHIRFDGRGAADNSSMMGSGAVPTTLAELRLPPTFVADHCLRVLAYQGSMSVVEIARHWRVRDSVSVEVVESLKAAGLLRAESSATDFDRLGRVRLSDAGQARVAAARERTWYAGPLPVAVGNLAGEGATAGCACSPAAARGELAALGIERGAADEIGQAVAGGATLALNGAAWDEQAAIAAAVGRALEGEARLPYAIFAAGSVIRVFDPNYHRVPDQPAGEAAEELDVLRSHAVAERTQWVTVAPPVVRLSGGVRASDVRPAFDDEAKFYLAPTPFAARGGILSVMDSLSDASALADLARLWLIPGRQGAGIIVLRSGERIEVPWRAATILFNTETAGRRAEESLPAAVRDAVAYETDITELRAEAAEPFLARRLSGAAFSPAAVTALAELLLRDGPQTRTAAARAAHYLSDRAAYEGAGFRLTPEVLQQALDFTGRAGDGPAAGLRAA